MKRLENVLTTVVGGLQQLLSTSTRSVRKPLGVSILAVSLGLSAVSVQAQSLTVYSAGPNRLIANLARDFQAETGTRVEVFQGTTGQILARLEAERANPVADVLISASWDSAEALKEAGDLLAYTPAGAEQVPDSLRDSHYIAQGVAALALVWNSRSDTPKPTDWSDLARAEYRNEVTMPDPAQSGAAFELLTGLLTALGEEPTWDLMQSLRANGMVVPGPNARALNPVLQGAKSAVFGAVDYIALGQRANGEAIEVIFPTSGTVLAPRPMMILSYSRQPDQAKAFLDFMLSEQGQQRVAEAYLMPARSDVEGLRPSLSALNVIDVDSAEMTAQREQILRRFRQVMSQ
ncbi:ABC transporter substrate-binding protein [Alkalilimnicola ehrlichii]|uniref:ABC transporter substrate-binding protein n=1 Tax=Alkalilimnicola ehrlichii TaxID=351052 RepID=A0A3E0WLQ3_9GAMM|nr:ABC transporter substrate-binding protein [Alkalilimnicola ehrlichii]RFA26789.1 ABC transporter substrate-binding protein [Alkalilimnicola ehrlichii]RFA33884.1 ABC transporter substrate-binding protein [Alkalilimnicola ehrlichii]